MKGARTLEAHCKALIAEHDSIRAAARALRLDHAYLYKLASGEKSNPREATLRRLGLNPKPLYLPAQKP